MNYLPRALALLALISLVVGGKMYLTGFNRDWGKLDDRIAYGAGSRSRLTRAQVLAGQVVALPADPQWDCVGDFGCK